MPACRTRSFSRTVVRPCTLFEKSHSSTSTSESEGHASVSSAAPRAFMLGGVSEQEGHCSKPEPRPFHCALRARQPFGGGGTRWDAENLRRDAECTCAPSPYTRSSTFARCYCGVLSRMPRVPNGWAPSRWWECPTRLV